MRVRRTYKEKSLKYGQIEVVGEDKVREVFGQTSVANHSVAAECGAPRCVYCGEVAMRRLLRGATVDTFFSKWELVEA